jgi:hypothetical protein
MQPSGSISSVQEMWTEAHSDARTQLLAMRTNYDRTVSVELVEPMKEAVAKGRGPGMNISHLKTRRLSICFPVNDNDRFQRSTEGVERLAV